jgi:branched-chain amino acid transport system permease protein
VSTRLGWLAAVAAVAAFLGLLAFGDPYSLRLATGLVMAVALASGWNLIGGMAGYPSFATAGFFGLGAYVGALAQSNGAPLPLAWAAASLAAALLALAVGWIVLRLRGHYFAIASLTIMVLLREIATTWTDLTGGGMGLNLPVLHAGILAQARLFFGAQLAVATLAVAISAAVAGGRLGFALRCIRQNETAAGMLGLDARRAKSIAFALSAAIAGPAGAIYASSVFYIEPGDVFDVLLTIKPVIMAMLGGAGTVAGPVLGAALFVVLDETIWRHLVAFHGGVLGVLVIGLAILLPQGVMGRMRRAA